MSRRYWYALLTVFVSCLLMTVAAFGISIRRTEESVQKAEDEAARTLRESEQKWCTIVDLFNDAYAENPPPTPLGQDIAREMKILAERFNC